MRVPFVVVVEEEGGGCRCPRLLMNESVSFARGAVDRLFRIGLRPHSAEGFGRPYAGHYFSEL